MEDYVQETIALRPMGCADCFWKIEGALKELDGFPEMAYDVAKITITVKYDPAKLSRPLIERMIEGLGYRLKGKKYDEVGIWEALKQTFGRKRPQGG
ncbi:MAG: cation transporter [Candidatus Bipolaricaulia bacterium]